MANVDTIDITKLILVEQGSTPSSPSAGKQKFYIRTSDHKACLVDSSGFVTSLGASLTDPTAARGDLIARGASALQALTIGATGKVLKSDGTDPSWGYSPYHGCEAFSTATITLTSGTNFPVVMASETDDSDTYHFTSAANLTGTVTKTATSVSIVGSGTLFTTELSVNQVISIPGTAAEIGVVKTITDNTHLDLWQTMANSASGQTVTRKNEYFAIPAGLGGKYLIEGRGLFSLGTQAFVVNLYILDIYLNGSLKRRNDRSNAGTNSTPTLEVVTRLALVPGDYIHLVASENTGANTTFGDTSDSYAAGRLSLSLIGA